MFKIYRLSLELEKFTRTRHGTLINKFVRFCSSSSKSDNGSESFPSVHSHIKGSNSGFDKYEVKSFRRSFSVEKLDTLSKDDLISMLFKLKAHNAQLRDLLQKTLELSDGSKKVKRRREFDFSKFHKRRILLKFCYLGWDYKGYPSQINTTRTIEDYLFKALKDTFLIESRQTSTYQGCSRTDAGVSALEQIISIDVRSKVSPEQQLTRDGVNSELNYCFLLNKKLPKAIRAISWRPLTSQSYSARFGCIDRTYKYFFPRGELNVEKMQEACRFFIGTHDFRNFCKLNVENGVVNHIRRLNNVEIKSASTNQDGIKNYDMFYLEINGSAFLWHMIRCIVSVLMMVGQQRESPEVVKELLDVEKNDRKPNYDFADEIPLNLFLCNLKDDQPDGDVFHQNSEMLNKWIYDESTLKEVIIDMQKQWCYKSVKTTMIYEMTKVLQNEYSINFPDQLAINSQVNNLIKDNAEKKLFDRQKGPSVADKIEQCEKKRRIKKMES